MKTGKEIKNNSFKNYNIVFGSVNNKNPKAIYINISAWAEPLELDGINYTRVIKNINKKIKQQLFNMFNVDGCLFSKDKTIVDLDIRESGIRYGKRSFMSCEITLFSKLEIPVNSELVKIKLNEILESIIKKIFDSNDSFKFHKRKK